MNLESIKEKSLSLINRHGNKLKPALDSVYNVAKAAEETLDPSSVVLKGFPRSLQLDSFSCGAQSVFSILKYFGKAKSCRNTQKELHTTQDGTDLDNIRKLFKKRGLITKRINMPTIAKIKKAINNGWPLLISLYDDAHYSVIYGYGRNSIYMADPMALKSLCRIPLKEFREDWDRWAMIVKLKEVIK